MSIMSQSSSFEFVRQLFNLHISTQESATRHVSPSKSRYAMSDRRSDVSKQSFSKTHVVSPLRQIAGEAIRSTFSSPAKVLDIGRLSLLSTLSKEELNHVIASVQLVIT